LCTPGSELDLISHKTELKSTSLQCSVVSLFLFLLPFNSQMIGCALRKASKQLTWLRFRSASQSNHVHTPAALHVQCEISALSTDASIRFRSDGRKKLKQKLTIPGSRRACMRVKCVKEWRGRILPQCVCLSQELFISRALNSSILPNENQYLPSQNNGLGMFDFGIESVNSVK
jgi:hypothetical protein